MQGIRFRDRMLHGLLGALLGASAAVAAAQTPRPPDPLGESLCGAIRNHFGPFDYRTVALKDRMAVELHHFTPPVAALQRGETGRIGADLEYTLRVMPNHHPALSAMARLAKREKTQRPGGATWSVECYFDRALRLAPDDGRTWAIYAGFLFEQNRADEALWSVNRAEELAPDDAMLAYNLGLVALDLKDDERALRLAKKAYAGGIGLPGLRARLEALGKWR